MNKNEVITALERQGKISPQITLLSKHVIFNKV
jgi:hypothetical protein